MLYVEKMLSKKKEKKKITISKIIDDKKHYFSICDSYAILTDSLNNLALKYDVHTIKGDFYILINFLVS